MKRKIIQITSSGVTENSMTQCELITKHISKRLKELRSGQSLSLRDLERRSGVSNARICQIEDGGNCSVVTLHKLASGLRVNIREMLP